MQSTPTTHRGQYSNFSAAFCALLTFAITGRGVATAKTAGTPSGSDVRSASGPPTEA